MTCTRVFCLLSLLAAPRAWPAEPSPPAALDAKALGALEREHSQSRDELLAAEARLMLLSEKLFRSRLVVQYAGELDAPFHLASLELWLDGGRVYRQEFEQAQSSQELRLFDGFLPPGRHRVELRLSARQSDETEAGTSASAGLSVELLPNSISRLGFEADGEGQAPKPADIRAGKPEARFEVEIEATFTREGEAR